MEICTNTNSLQSQKKFCRPCPSHQVSFAVSESALLKERLGILHFSTAQQFCKTGIPVAFAFGLVSILFQRKLHIAKETAASGKPAHDGDSRGSRHNLVFEGLQDLCVSHYSWSIENVKDICADKHCIFIIYIHLVYVTKSRRDVFSNGILNDLKPIFVSVCAEF